MTRSAQKQMPQQGTQKYGSLERKEFGINDLLGIVNGRGKGIIYYLDLNSYETGRRATRVAANCRCSFQLFSYVRVGGLRISDETAVLQLLPIADILCGAVAAVKIMMTIRDRARHGGGSYYGNVFLTATDCAQVNKGFGLYSPEVVKKIQKTHKCGPTTPHRHMKDLLYVVVSDWMKTTHILKRNETFTFGHSVRMLAPLVKYENAEVSPKWLAHTIEAILLRQGGLHLLEWKKIEGQTEVEC